MITTLKLTASDTLFFGSGRPFTMDEDSWSIGIFPPNPETLFGFLRGAYFKENMGDYVKVGIKNSDPTENLNLHDYGLFSNHDNIKLYAWPLDMVENKTKDRFEILSLLAIDDEIISNQHDELKGKLIYEGTDKIRNVEGICLINETDFKKYLSEDYKGIIPLKLTKLISKEPKIGIRRDRSDTTNKSLYRLNMNRLETDKSKLSIWLSFEELTFNTNINRLGGEGKLVFIEDQQTTLSIESVNDFKKDDIVRMYLATPALFPEGWKPDIIGAELLTGITGKPQFIGGFDAQLKQPKSSRKAIPAGSVYYFKIIANTISLGTHIGLDNHKGYGKVYFNKITKQLMKNK